MNNNYTCPKCGNTLLSTSIGYLGCDFCGYSQKDKRYKETGQGSDLLHEDRYGDRRKSW